MVHLSNNQFLSNDYYTEIFFLYQLLLRYLLSSFAVFWLWPEINKRRKLKNSIKVIRKLIGIQELGALFGLMGLLVDGPRLLRCPMINILNLGESYPCFQYKVLNLTNSQINTILWIKFSDVTHMHYKLNKWKGIHSILILW